MFLKEPLFVMTVVKPGRCLLALIDPKPVLPVPAIIFIARQQNEDRVGDVAGTGGRCRFHKRRKSDPDSNCIG